MQVNVKRIYGDFNVGYALDKHTLYSTPIGENEQGHMQFDTKRTDAGEAVFQLKYRDDATHVQALAHAVARHIIPSLPQFGLIAPMPASKQRVVQPVTAVAQALGAIIGKPVFTTLLSKAPGGQSLKNLNSREDKDAALAGQITVNHTIGSNGRYNVLLVDDLFHTGATLDAACQALRTYAKIGEIYVATLTWRPS